MSDRSAIEWTDSTWNPIRARNPKTGKVGWHCEHVTPGCEHCYAEGFNMRLGTGLPFKPGHRKDVEIFLDDNMLQLPLRWKKPRKIFVGSMTDLFADFVTDEMLDKIFAVMALSPQHTFQVLTKRAERMRDYLVGLTNQEWWKVRLYEESKRPYPWPNWPLPNVWLGVSCENQEQADARIPLLLQTPAAVLFVSAEPLLGPIDLASPLYTGEAGITMRGYLRDHAEPDDFHHHARKLDWVIAGGESGPKARPMHPDWARALRDQCKVAGVAFHFKQWGEFREFDTGSPAIEEVEVDSEHAESILPLTMNPSWLTKDGRHFRTPAEIPEETPCRLIERVGKKAAGRLLDGVQHNAFPTGSAA